MNRHEFRIDSDSNCQATRDAAEIWRASIAAVHGRDLVGDFVTVSEDGIALGHLPVSNHETERICLIGAGKAASAMVAGFLGKLEGTSWEQSRRVFGQINIPRSASSDDRQCNLLERFGISVNQVRPASVNLPTPAAVDATRSILRMVKTLNVNDLCVVLLSGGGSALLTAPRAPVTLAEKLEAIEFLFASNADIVDVNRIRSVLSDVKRGGLVRHCPSRSIVTLVISDIIGDPLHLIAGGPTTDHWDDGEEVFQVARRYDPDEKRMAKSIWCVLKENRLQSPDIRSNLTNTVSKQQQARHFILANNETAVSAASTVAARLGYRVESETIVPSRSAEDAGRDLMGRLEAMTEKSCLISGGEPTVMLAPRDVRGIGGRNQQLVLAAHQSALQSDLIRQRDWCLLSAGTDGQDGVSDAAGAWLDADVMDRADRNGLDAAHLLTCNNAAVFFQNAGGLFRCGATHTNVCDIRIAIRNSE